MLIHSDWHIHTTASHDGCLSIETLIQHAGKQGLRGIGIADHVNMNDTKFLGAMRKSVENVKRLQAAFPAMVAGVELTPIAKPQFDYAARNGTCDGFTLPGDRVYDLELAVTKEEMISLGIRYAVGATHRRLDVVDFRNASLDLNENLREWFRQMMWLANDDRVTILGHPWDHFRALWYEDFSVIPKSMNEEFGAALKENGKFVECNAVLLSRGRKTSDKFCHQYAEFLRYLFESGVRITYGSDCHGELIENPHYPDKRADAEVFLEAAGFKDGDFSELTEADLW